MFLVTVLSLVILAPTIHGVDLTMVKSIQGCDIKELRMLNSGCLSYLFDNVYRCYTYTQAQLQSNKSCQWLQDRCEMRTGEKQRRKCCQAIDCIMTIKFGV
eukprot:sb/3478446/